MLLRPHSLRGGGPSVPRNELPLLDVPGTTGAPFVAWFSVRPSEFRFAQGHPSRFRSSSKATRSFCPNCGTQLTFQADDYPDQVDITTCSLDHPEAVPPRDQTYTSSKVQWIELADGLPQFAQARS
jgi:hypothetical protein